MTFQTLSNHPPDWFFAHLVSVVAGQRHALFSGADERDVFTTSAGWD